MDDISDIDYKEKAFQNIFRMFLLPEIKKRQEKCELPIPFDLDVAQILFFSDNRQRIIRFNDEVKAIALIKPISGIVRNKGALIYENEIENVEKMTPSEEVDPNCAYVIIKRFKKGWLFSFDFKYNKGLSKEYLDRGNEFLESAQYSYDKKNWGAFVDNLYSATELYASAILLLNPISKLKSHSAVIKRFHHFAHLGNINLNYSKILKELEKLRPRGRYMDGKIIISDNKARELLDYISNLKKEAEQRRK